MDDSSPAHGLTGVAQTLLTPLYARAHSAELLPSSGFRDPLAAQLLESTGYAPPEVLRGPGSTLSSLHRAMVFDTLTRQFADAHPDGTVVSVGIGLCTRAQRLVGQTPGSVVNATGARFRSGARDGDRLARLARLVPGWELTAEHQIMERISRPHHAAALLFRAVTLGGRPYAIAHLHAKHT